MTGILVCVLQTTVVALVTLWIGSVFLRRSPQLAASCWGVGIVISAALVLIAALDVPRLWDVSSAAIPNRDLVASEQDEADGPGPAGTPWAEIRFPVSTISPSLREQVDSLIEYSVRIHRPLRIGSLFVAVAASGLALIRLLIGFCRIRCLRDAHSVELSGKLKQTLLSLQSLAGFRCPIVVRRSRSLSSPCVSWLHSHCVFVPGDFSKWSAEEQQVALAHEVAHLQRHDPFWRLLIDLCLTVVVWHPLLVMLRRRFEFAQELATDRTAARLLNSESMYRRGLARLVLRLDAPVLALSLVSLSSRHVIRRIKMFRTDVSPMPRWKEVSILGAVTVVCLFVSAWTVSAGDETAPVSSPLQTLADVADPWDELGECSGYLALKPSVIAQHSFVRQLYEIWLNKMLYNPDLASVGISPETTDQIVASLDVRTREIPEHKRESPDGPTSTLLVGVGSFVVRCSVPVAWKDLADQLPVVYRGHPGYSHVEKLLAKQNGTNTLRLVSASEAKTDQKRMHVLQCAWEQVGSCALAAVHCTEDVLSPALAAEKDPFAVRPLLEASSAIAVGISVEGTSEVQLRVVIVPKSQQAYEDLESLARDTCHRMVTTADVAASFAERGRAELHQLLRDIEQISVETVTAQDGSRLVVLTTWTDVDLSCLLPQQPE